MPLAVAMGHMYTWPSFYPVYPLVGSGVAWLGRWVRQAVNRLGLPSFGMGDPCRWMRHVGHGLIQNWTWKEGAALASIGLGLVTWGMIRWKLERSFHGYVQMSLKDDLKDIPKHYGLERVPLPEPNGQGNQECEEWRPKGASAFWVAEIGDEVVGCIGLGKSFINIRSFPSASPFR